MTPVVLAAQRCSRVVTLEVLCYAHYLYAVNMKASYTSQE